MPLSTLRSLIFTTTCKSERGEDIIEELHEFHFTDQALAPDHIRIALVELTVAPFCGRSARHTGWIW
jgi:hypothetical protein